MPGLYQKKGRATEEQSWYKVMWLTGVDYFSTLVTSLALPLWPQVRCHLSGYRDVAPITREVLRQAEHNPARRPRIYAL